MKTQRVQNAYLKIYYSTFSSKRFVILRLTKDCSTVTIKKVYYSTFTGRLFRAFNQRVDYSTFRDRLFYDRNKRVYYSTFTVDYSMHSTKGLIILLLG
jgi:hypothetical protein